MGSSLSLTGCLGEKTTRSVGPSHRRNQPVRRNQPSKGRHASGLAVGQAWQLYRLRPGSGPRDRTVPVAIGRGVASVPSALIIRESPRGASLRRVRGTPCRKAKESPTVPVMGGSGAEPRRERTGRPRGGYPVRQRQLLPGGSPLHSTTSSPRGYPPYGKKWEGWVRRSKC